MRSRKVTSGWLFASFLALCAATACESDPEDAPAAFTPECDECLSREECRVPWQLCIDDAACKEYVVCALRAECYAEPPGPACVERAGCEPPPEDSEASGASEAFETCARTECAAICRFVEP